MLSNQKPILVYTTSSSQRLRYVLDVFFHYIVQTEYQITEIQADYQHYTGPKIQYTPTNAKSSGLFIPASDLLQDNTEYQDFVVSQLFTQASEYLNGPSPEKKAYNFDVLAFCFYVLSQYELYQDHRPKDHLARLPGGQCRLYKAHLLHRPVVDEFCLQMVQKLQGQWPGFSPSFPKYQYRPTYDIDISWAYKHRSLARQLGAIGKDLAKADLRKLRQRWRVFRGLEKDPFDTFDFLDELHQRYQLQPIYFFLLGDYGGLDRNIRANHPAQKDLFRRLAQQYPTGIHPSIRSGQREAQLSKEFQRFADITGQKAERSRQHYLVLDLPATYRQLWQRGVKEEYSLGFADQPGFRAGIARPFPWYDLEQEQKTGLILHPFVMMDQALRRVTDKDHSSLSEKVLSFAQSAKAVNGQIYTVWHNSSFAELEGWGGWKIHYEKLIKKLI